ncbi:AGE family epimerase/isomerase [Phenylobacterium sp.]|uniref:AGE family epimerase/isomerase n=1 Tax=Phenylobacterium sp. TaxID=1871053 RepID=UPI002D06035F|nr:AGE family epimerase/isomerase [Phenylobacterium sp.]HVI31076.1 AGE family epimerase/isomerase [Phenylobacterium sp.]
MTIYPVVMCGGSGSRLWPASRPDRPKQFIPLVDERSTFETTLLRLQALDGASRPLVICGPAHAGWVRRGAPEGAVDILIEPAPRDSAAAVAAAAAWVAARDPEAVLVIVPADHHIPDAAAFSRAIATAARAAGSGGVVTLGVRPTAPSTAYGYIAPGVGVAGDVRAVRRFLEKPQPKVARDCVAAGHLWNSGNFIARADILLQEFRAHAPAVLDAAQAAVAESVETPAGWRLGDGFLKAPGISFDYAIMEKTGRALVLPVDFRWSDLGAWDAVLAASAKDRRGNAAQGAVRLVDTDRSLVRVAPGGPNVTLLGLSDIAVVGDGEHLLLCSLACSQGVKSLAEEPPPPPPRERLERFAGELDLWLRTAALPLWWTVGADSRDGGYVDLIDLGGRPVAGPKRARVQARQSFVYAEASRLGMPGDWGEAAAWGLEYLQRRHRRPDGLYRTLVDANGNPLNEHAYLYDHAFVLLALATASWISPAPREARAAADDLLDRVVRYMRHSAGGFRESGAHPFQANAHMHLLEAALAWIDAGGGERWLELASEVVNLALSRFVDHGEGFLREFFSADWSPAAGSDRGLVEPGHQLEWSWLLGRWDDVVGDARAAAVARTLFDTGRLGLDATRGVVVDELDNVTSIRSGRARLWPQTEHLRAALAQAAREPDGARYLACAADAADAIRAYLDTPVRGLWRDKLLADGRFVEEPAPASSLYHIMGAYRAVARWQEQGRAADREGRVFRAAE